MAGIFSPDPIFSKGEIFRLLFLIGFAELVQDIDYH